MGLLRFFLILGGLAAVAHIFLNLWQSEEPLHFGGQVEKGYEDVQKAFQQNFIDGWESEGASLAVYVKGKKVVDLWGGYADKQSNRRWKKDTISVTFSTTKAVAAVCIAMLVDRGRLKYDDLVSKHWPGFARNGKGNITIEWVLSHMAGLPYLDTVITEEMAMDHDAIRRVLENETPKFPPGTGSGYHAFTYGWLVDQIVRHTDEKRRGVGQFFREELARPHGIDFHIGLNSTEEGRVARVALLKITELVSQVWHDTRALRMIVDFILAGKNGTLSRAAQNVPWVNVAHKSTVNNPEQHAIEQAAALGIGNARALAHLYSLLVNGRIVGEKTLSILKEPVINDTDYAITLPATKGHGFFYWPTEGDEKNLLVGHSGNGCQQATFDIKNRIALAYVTNGMKVGVYDSCRTYARIHKAVFGVVARHV